MKRRAFLKNTSLLTLPGILGGFNVAAMPSGLLASLVNGDSDRVLVLIELAGGNDGLNTFIPLDGYDNLANARPDVIIPENELLGMTDTIKVHPSMSGILDLYNEESLTILMTLSLAILKIFQMGIVPIHSL